MLVLALQHQQRAIYMEGYRCPLCRSGEVGNSSMINGICSQGLLGTGQGSGVLILRGRRVIILALDFHLWLCYWLAVWLWAHISLCESPFLCHKMKMTQSALPTLQVGVWVTHRSRRVWISESPDQTHCLAFLSWGSAGILGPLHTTVSHFC